MCGRKSPPNFLEPNDWSFQFRKDPFSARKMSKERLISKYIILELQNIGIKKRFL